MALSWQDFEQASRDVIRSMGYYVHPGPYLIHDKQVDIYGTHHRFYTWKNERPDPHLFVGECKQWNKPIDVSVIYELSGLLESIATEHTVLGAVFSQHGASSRALTAAQRVNVMVFDREDIATYLRDIYNRLPAGKLERPSFPGYWNLAKVMELIHCCLFLPAQKQAAFSSRDLRAIVTKEYGWTDKSSRTWTTSLLDIAVIMGLVEFVEKRGRSNYYRIRSHTKQMNLQFETDRKTFLENIRIVVMKNIFVREIVMYLLIQGPTIKADIKRALEYIRPGFDQDSIAPAIDLGRELGIFENIEEHNNRSPIRVTESATQQLWQ